ncbi:unnamed protein product [Ilex paraguariensis]|uniref:Uncharacterized protein n=1 Tax=Ilex paraguariensis TaxID=185542 RepID=A0ABC8RKP4_9AQUA
MADHQAGEVLLVKPRSSNDGVSVILRIILLLLLTDITLSRSIIKTLPGFSGELPVKLETGYVGIGEKDEIQLFYYFVESERSPEDDPLILWLAGGPGCSATRSFFYEIGPFKFDMSNFTGNQPPLVLAPNSWTKVASIIFIDQPVGTGFSYATNAEAYKTSDKKSANQTYEFLRKWLVDHPKFLKNPLYIGGISYIGVVVPVLVEDIYNGNEAGNEPQMNIKGYILCNPLTDRNGDVNSRIDYAHRVALLSDELYESAKANCNGNYIEVDPDNGLCVRDLQEIDKCTDRINQEEIYEPKCIQTVDKSKLLGWDRSLFEAKPMELLWSIPRSPEDWCRSYVYYYSVIWANDEAVQSALHIREGTLSADWVQCNLTIKFYYGKPSSESYAYDLPDVVGYHRNLTKRNCQALILSGDLDMIVPYLSTEKWIRSLNLAVESTWEPWLVDGQVAGYRVGYAHNDYSLTFATVKGAGHTCPEYKHKQCFSIVDWWFSNQPL